MPLVVRTVSNCTAAQTGTLASGSSVVTGLSDTSLLAGALRVSGAGVPASTFVASIDSTTQVTLTAAASASGTAALTFSIEPVDLPSAKLHCKVDDPAEDALVARLIVAARRLCEVAGKVVFLTSTFDQIDDAFPFTGGSLNRQVRQFYGMFGGGQGAVYPGVMATNAGVIVLPRAPVLSVTSIGYLDVNGQAQVMAPSLYTVTTGSPGRVAPVFGQIWPVTLPQIGAVTTRFTAGYGSTSEAVPENAVAAVLLTVGHLYINRAAVASGEVFETLPMGVNSLLSIEDGSGGYA